MNIKVIFSSGGRYNKNPEQQIADNETLYTAKRITKALKVAGHAADLVEVNPRKISGVKQLETDVVFNLCEWSGRDYPLAVKVLKYLEKSKIAYTGADSVSFDWCCNKVLMKKMFDKRNILTPVWTVIYPDDENDTISQNIKRLQFPIIVKPAYEHCAIGIDEKSVLYSQKDTVEKITKLIKDYNQPAIVEEYIVGREFTVTLIKNHSLHFFPPAEVVFNPSYNRKLLSFDTKWSKDDTFTSKILKNKNLVKKLEKVSTDAFMKMNCRGYVRIDARVRDNKVYILEINVNPSIYPDPTYGLTVSTKAGGWNFVKLVDEIANSATIPSETS